MFIRTKVSRIRNTVYKYPFLLAVTAAAALVHTHREPQSGPGKGEQRTEYHVTDQGSIPGFQISDSHKGAVTRTIRYLTDRGSNPGFQKIKPKGGPGKGERRTVLPTQNIRVHGSGLDPGDFQKRTMVT